MYSHVDEGVSSSGMSMGHGRRRNGGFFNRLMTSGQQVMAAAFLNQGWLFLAAVGLAMAIVAVAIDSCLSLTWRIKGYMSSTGIGWLDYMLWIGTSCAYAAAAAAVTRFLSPNAAGSGIPTVKSILSGMYMPKHLDLRTLLAKMGGLILSYGAGLSIGKEGPYVHIGACVANCLAELPFFHRVRTNYVLKYQMIAASCAAGVSVAFGAPIGGVIFAVEVTTTFYLIKNFQKGFFCAVAAAVFVRIMGQQPLVAFFVTDFEPFNLYQTKELLMFALIGVLFGMAAVGYIVMTRKLLEMRRHYKILVDHPYGQLMAVAFVCALIAYPFKSLRTSERRLLDGLFSAESAGSEWTEPSLYLNLSCFLLAKVALTALSSVQEVPVGLYTPVFVCGAAAGRLCGELVAVAFPEWDVVPGGYAVVGAAAFSAGVTRTLSTSVIVFELTGQLHHASLLAVRGFRRRAPSGP